MDHSRSISFSEVTVACGHRPRAKRLDLSSCFGCSTALLLAQLIKQDDETFFVVLVPDGEAAHRLKDDIAALIPSALLRYLPPPGESPYEHVRPERGASLARIAALSELYAQERTLRVLIVTASSWLKKVPLKETISSKLIELKIDTSLDSRATALALDGMGYQRVPLVEDPGSFSLRGEILDVWPPTSAHPLRLELEFHKLKSIVSFDPGTQRKHKTSALLSCILGPAKESACNARPPAQSAQMLRALCDEVVLPSSKTKSLIDEVLAGRMFIGETAYLPALCELVPLSSQLPTNTFIIVEDPAAVTQLVAKELQNLEELYVGRASGEPAFAPAAHSLSQEELDHSIETLPRLVLHRTPILGGSAAGFAGLSVTPAACSSLGTEDLRELSEQLKNARQTGGDLTPLVDFLGRQLESGKLICITARSASQVDRIVTLLKHRDLPCEQVEPEELAKWVLGQSAPLTADRSPKLKVAVVPLAQGIFVDHENLVLITSEEIFGHKRPAANHNKRARLVDALDDLRHLSVGDYVVHVDHGIGKYQGLVHQSVGDITVDVLAIEYQSGDRLLLPVYRLNQIQKYSGEGAVKVDRLGGQTFAKTKSRVRKKARDIADQLLRVYSARHQKERPPIAQPGDEYLNFEASFPFEETPDQAAAIVDVLNDLQKDTVMDRLVCGDVGFGKTEVALRAAFLAAQAGRQVALLCPTTILADQHLQTFSRRLLGTGINVHGLSRFETKSAIEKTLAGLRTGQVDLVVGTHRLLSKDVFFKNLGLLVIDEEQRFGVTHKERLKELRAQVDVLTLSATPIPRTLNLAVGGLLDMSVILTPPHERRAIRTLIARFDEQIITQAITRELARGGQVFYVYNRVEGLVERAARLRQLIPGLKVTVAHGQMSERELETHMHGFVQGQYDVLCATAIIESGLDIPRANTIIIDRADLFGLAQLYQLRGRVGRATERAYCYLLVPGDESLNAEATKRIETLERYSDLGSGIKVASIDMELRGVGDILGAEQTGYTSQVGFELFSEMLAQATLELKGETYVPEVDPELSVDVEAYLPESYIDDIGVRLSLYKRYASAHSVDRVRELDEEVNERFGAPPLAARAFSQLMVLKTRLRELRALGLSATKKTLHLHLRADTSIVSERLVSLVGSNQRLYTVSPDGRLTRRAGALEQFAHGLEHTEQMLRELVGEIA